MHIPSNIGSQKVIRKAFQSPDRYHNDEQTNFHTLHCLATLHQDLMCRADDTLIPSGNHAHVIGDQQVMSCRNWDALISWARAPERHSCYNMISDYIPIAHTLEATHTLVRKQKPNIC